MKSLTFRLALQTLAGAAMLLIASSASAQGDADMAVIKAANERLLKAFNANKADEVAALFHAQGEFEDEGGIVYTGQAAIKGLMTKYFEKFPGVKLQAQVDSIRVVGPVAFEDGTRSTVTKDEKESAVVRYTLVRAKIGNEWPIVSLRDYIDDSDLTPHDRLQMLAWLVGEWVNEGNDAVVRIKYRWSDDKNFLLGDFHVERGGSTVMQSTQRIGWDPLAGKVRSWLFDSDGGYGDGNWTLVDKAWIIKSTAVLPDGQTGSATVTLTPLGKDRYSLKGTDRFAGDERAEDFEHTVTRRPPMPTRK